MAHTRPTDPPPVRIEPDDQRAWCGARRLELPPKTFAVFRHLVEHAGRLVTKKDLLAAVWGGTIVSEAALTSCIRDLRKALTDSSRAPRYIETVHRRGFRFVGPIDGPPRTGGAEAPKPGSRPTALVGRDAELARLHASLATVLDGQRRLVFVTGEAGIGKSALVEAFLAQIGTAPAVRIGCGQCVEQYGAGEPYLPLLEALGRLGRESDQGQLVRILKQFAPTWLAQLPALLSDADLEAVQRRSRGTTRDRMLRELLDALDALSVETPLVLFLEDLHWSDAATVDLLAMFARRRDAARLLIVGTYRPADVAVGGHPMAPVKQELQAHGYCAELSLEFLTGTAVGRYLDVRFPRASLPSELARLLHESTGGNPLFLVNVIDDLIGQGQLREDDGRWTLSGPVDRIGAAIPHSLAQIIDKQIERLTPDEQAVLAVGSVAGAEFSAAVSTVDGIDARDGERCCAALARRGQFLRATGADEWPDGTVAGRFGFIHAAYRNALYARVPIGHRVGLHLGIGAHLERAHGAHTSEIAGELAMHFENGRDFERGVHHRGQAAEVALRRHAYGEAVNHATRALEVLGELPESPERDRQELLIQTSLGAASVATAGWGAPDVARAYGRARELCTRMGATPPLFPVLLGLCGFYLTRGELSTAQEIAAQLLVVANATGDSAVLVGAHNTAGMTSFYGGEFARALEHFTEAGRIHAADEDSANRLRAFSVDHDPGVSCAAHTALTLSVLGQPDRAAAQMRDCLGYARSIDHPVSLVMALNFAAMFYQDRRDRPLVEEIEAARFAHATTHGLDLFLQLGEIYRGWLASEAGHGEDAVTRIRRGIETYRAVGAALGTPTFLAILADVCGKYGRADEGLAALGEALALAEQTGLHCWDAELHRLKGTLLLRLADSSARSRDREAEACYLEAIEIGRGQGATSFELRGATSLARLWQRQRKTEQAHALLAEVYARFAEGHDTADLLDAGALLAELTSATPRGRDAPVPSSRRRRRAGDIRR